MSEILNDKAGRNTIDWSSKRNETDRLRNRPHVANRSNTRGDKNTRYFSSVDADIYFGNYYIDDVANIAWSVQQNAMPIYGYNSYTFDDIAMGSRIIQGQFAVNFTQANYLSTVLNSFVKISRKMYSADIPVVSRFTDADKARRNKPMWDAGFDIVVGYGEKSKDSYEQVITLDCCQITGCSQQLDYNGEPVMEVYSFMARDMKFSTVSSEKPTDNSTVTKQDESNHNMKTDPLVILDKDNNKNNVGYLNIKDSNKSLNIKYQLLSNDGQNGTITETLITLKVAGSNEFNVGKKLKIGDTTLTLDLTDTEKSQIRQYCEKYGAKEVQAYISYSTAFKEAPTARQRNIKINITM